MLLGGKICNKSFVIKDQLGVENRIWNMREDEYLYTVTVFQLLERFD